MPVNWYSSTFNKIHFDMHTPESVQNVGRDFDPDAFARSVKEAGAEAVCFFSRCAYGWSYYPTQVGLPHPNLSRDLFGEGVAALKARGLRVLAYVAICNMPRPMADQHPEWAMRDADGSLQSGHGGGVRSCPFGGFLEEMLIPQLAEIAERYPVDGFFLDGVYQFFNNVCYCDNCRRAFGRDIPTEDDDPHWRGLRHLQVQRVWDMLGRAAEKVLAVRPGCLMGVNWLASVRWSVAPPASIGYLTGDPGMNNCAFETTYNLAAWGWRDTPSDLMTQRMLHSWQDFTCRVPETIQTDFAAGLAGGGKLFVGDLLQPVDAAPDPEAMKLLKGCFSFADERRPLAVDVRRRSDVAILSSPEAMRQRGRQWAVDDAPLRGALLAVVEDGLTADILYDGDLEKRLDRYQTLVVPEQRFISRDAGRAVQLFAERGGGVVILGDLPACLDPDESDDAAERSTFEGIAGLKSEGRHPFDLGYLRLRGTPAEDMWRVGDAHRPAIPVPGAPAKVQLDGARMLAPLVAPGETYQIGARPPGAALEEPALTLHKPKLGRVMFCALPLASDLWKRGNPGAKYVMEAMVRAVTKSVSVERIGPPCVEVTRAEGPGRTVVHLVAYQPGRRTAAPQVVESPPEISGVQVRLKDRRTVASLRAWPGGVLVGADRTGTLLCVDVPPFVIHAAIVVEWG